MPLSPSFTLPKCLSTLSLTLFPPLSLEIAVFVFVLEIVSLSRFEYAVAFTSVSVRDKSWGQCSLFMLQVYCTKFQVLRILILLVYYDDLDTIGESYTARISTKIEIYNYSNLQSQRYSHHHHYHVQPPTIPQAQIPTLPLYPRSPLPKPNTNPARSLQPPVPSRALPCPLHSTAPQDRAARPWDA